MRSCIPRVSGGRVCVIEVPKTSVAVVMPRGRGWVDTNGRRIEKGISIFESGDFVTGEDGAGGVLSRVR